MNYIHFALVLSVSLLIVSTSSAANRTNAELTQQSQQRLTGMREALGDTYTTSTPYSLVLSR